MFGLFFWACVIRSMFCPLNRPALPITHTIIPRHYTHFTSHCVSQGKSIILYSSVILLWIQKGEVQLTALNDMHNLCFRLPQWHFMLRGLFCFVSHHVKTKTEYPNQPFFSLTNTSCNMITDVLESYMKTESLSVFVQREKSVMEFGSLANVLRVHAFLSSVCSSGRIAYISLSNGPSVLSTQPKKIISHPRLSAMIKTTCVIIGFLSGLPNWAKLWLNFYSYKLRLLCSISKER